MNDNYEFRCVRCLGGGGGQHLRPLAQEVEFPSTDVTQQPRMPPYRPHRWHTTGSATAKTNSVVANGL